MSDINRIDELKNEIQRLLRMLERHMSDDFYPRNALGEIIRFDRRDVVTFDHPIGDATPFIEIKDGIFNYVISERGTEFQRKTGDADAILYMIFSGLTSSLASGFSARNPVDNQDFRRVLFAKQVELLRLLNSDWADAAIEEQRLILRIYPYSDQVAQ